MLESHRKQRVSYFYDSNLGSYYYGSYHPMKPHRMRMTHHLVLAYGLHSHMDVFRAPSCSNEEMSRFHTDDYVDFLQRITQDNAHEYSRQLQHFNIGDDCPVFEGLYDFSRLAAGASIAAAVRLNHGLTDVAINWAGGLHHAHKSAASGFCYINDIVLCILELLRYHPRVLYVDIDVHHGDGVEEAFYLTDRVMTVSLHKYGNFFPGTGALCDVGEGRGRYTSLNAPLKDGITDAAYESLFKPIIEAVMETYRPTAVVLQCGADSLAGDRLGLFNLSSKGHSDCVRLVRSFGLPTVLLGGGGYNIKNVSRIWTYETAVAVNRDSPDVLPRKIPAHCFSSYYTEGSGGAVSGGGGIPGYLNVKAIPSLENLNTTEYLDLLRTELLENIRMLKGAPSVQMSELPPSLLPDYDPTEERERMEERLEAKREGKLEDINGRDVDDRQLLDMEGLAQRDDEFYDGDGDVDGNIGFTKEDVFVLTDGGGDGNDPMLDCEHKHDAIPLLGKEDVGGPAVAQRAAGVMSKHRESACGGMLSPADDSDDGAENDG